VVAQKIVKMLILQTIDGDLLAVLYSL